MSNGYERPGRGVYVVATKTTPHEAPATESGLVGRAVKQKARKWSDGLVNPETIAIGESFLLRTKGITQVDTSGAQGTAIAAGTKGQGVYIRPADNTLHLSGATAAGDLPFGRVVEVVSDPAASRGVPANTIRIDLDQKDTLAIV